jgi:hypothetical protein
VEEGTFRVTCWTCHRGNATPETAPPPEPDEAAPAEQPAPAEPPAGHHDHGQHQH